MKKKLISEGKDYTYMLTIFREIILKSGIKENENLIFSGCQGTCYAMATFFCFGIRDLKLHTYFVLDSDINQLWRLEYVKNLGVIATRKENPIKAKVIVLMSGLMRVPFHNTLRLIDDALASDGIIIGETVVPGLFEKAKWDKEISFDYIFEFSMEKPSSFEVVSMD